MFRSTLFLSLSLLFLACGGGGTSVETTPLKDIQFVDAPVDGIDYICGERDMQTQTKEIEGEIKHGIASCRHEPVIFSLGSLILGQIDKFKDGQIIRPQDLVNVSQNIFENEEVLKIAMFIQSLDDDGDINKSINITKDIKDQISIISLNTLSMEEVKTEITKLKKTSLDINDVKEHLIENSGIPYIKDLTISILDNRSIGETIGNLNIINSQNISKIKILEGEDSDFFTFNKIDGSIQINKPLNYKEKYRYIFDIQANTVNDTYGESNIATVIINVDSNNPNDMNPISKPIIQNSMIYTNTELYNLTLQGRAGTKIYIDGTDINKTIPTSGQLQLLQNFLQNNSSKEFSVTLGYDNGKRSEASLFTLIHDDIKPSIKTSSNLFIKENIKIVTNMEIEDSSDVNYSISGIDSDLFNISSIGELSFKNPSNYETPLDSAQNNIYNITVNVVDKAGNLFSKDFVISVIDVLDSPPTISPFNIDTVTDTIVGSSLGTVSIQEGDSPIEELNLTGDGSENFKLNSNGTIVLVKSINIVNIYMLTITATNKFGTSTKTITINVKDGSKLAKAQLGLLSNATIKIIKLNQLSNKEELIYTEKTSNTGTFDTHSKELEDDTFYIFEASDGMDIDTNDDAIKDEVATENKGVLRLISKGEWIKNATSTIRITPISEMQYAYMVNYIKDVNSFDYNKLEMLLNDNAKILLSHDLNNDGTINSQDIIIFNPSLNKDNIYKTLKNNNSYQNIVNKIRDNNVTYVEDLFYSHTIKLFENCDDFKILGSFVYVYADNYFYIYDLINQKRVSEIYLPKTHEDEFAYEFDIVGFDGGGLDYITVQVFLDLNNNLIFLSNLDGKTIVIDAQDSNNPKVLTTYISGTGKHILQKQNNVLFFTDGVDSNYPDKNNEYIITDIKALNISDLYKPLVIDIPNLLYFDKVIKYQDKVLGYIIPYGNCDSCYIYVYNLTNIEEKQTIALETTYKVPSARFLQLYIDEYNYLYSYDPDYNILDIYKLSNNLDYQGTLYPDEDLGNGFINRYGKTLYMQGINYIYFINILEPTKPFIEKKIIFQYSKQNLKFYDTIFSTKKHIVDINSYIYSSPYVTLQEDVNASYNSTFKDENISIYKLDLNLFKRFSIN